MKEIDGQVYIKTSTPFNDSDVAIIKLKITIDALEKNIAEIDHKIREKKVELKNCIAKKERSRAKMYLRQKKALDKDFMKKTSTLNNLDQVLQAIKDAQDNAKVVKTLKQARGVLSEELKNQDVDKIHDIIDDIKEYVEQNDEISQALASGAQDNISDAVLEQELKKLLEEENEIGLQKALDALIISDEKIEDTDDQAGDKEAKIVTKKQPTAEIM